MRHRIKKTTLGRPKAHREMMLRNLAASILIYERVNTTLAKAKAVRTMVERSITVAKKNDLTARRNLIQVFPQRNAVNKAMEVLGKRYETREGGYTRIVKLPPRAGDGASMALIELV